MSSEDLTDINGIGDAIAEELGAAGFETVEEVKSADVEDLADVHLLGESSARAIIDEDGGDEAAQGKGRPTVYDQDTHETIVETIQNVEPLTSAAERASISVDTIRNWYQEGEQQSTLPPSEQGWEYEFFRDCASARADAKAELLRKMENDELDWRMLAWKLEHLYESEFYLPIKQEIEQEVDATHDHDVEHGLDDSTQELLEDLGDDLKE